MKFQIIIRASHPALGRDEIISAMQFNTIPAFKLRATPLSQSEKWKQSVTNHLACWEVKSEGYDSINTALSAVHELLFQRKEEIEKYNQADGRLEVYLTIFSEKSWGDTLTPDVLMAYGKAGISLSLELFFHTLRTVDFSNQPDDEQ